MKISKSILRRLKNIVLSVGFVLTFAFGHLIACNSSQVDNTPVITVPIQQPLKVLSPTTINVNGDNVNVFYLFNGVQTLTSNYSLNWTLDFKLYASDSILFCNVGNSYLISGANYGEDESTFNLGLLSSPTDLRFLCNYTLSALPSPSTHEILTLNVFLTYRNNTQTYSFTYHTYDANYGTSSSGLIDDKVTSGFIDFMFNDYQSLFNNGVDSVLNNPNDYNLYTYNEYLAYGQSEYQRGFSASQNTLSFAGFVHEIFRSPITMFKDAFNFNLPLGNGEIINVGAILTFFLSIGIALTIVQLVLKIGGK